MRITRWTFLIVLAFQTSVLAKGAVTKSRFETIEAFNKVLHLIETQYYREVDTEKLIQGALKGMMDTLDPHSTYLPKDYFAKLQEDTQGEFGGLGVEVTQKDGVIIVIAPIDDTPAFKAGLRPGDKIVEINHESVVGVALEDVVDQMRGKPNSNVNIGIKREGTAGIIYMDLKRQIIKTSPIKAFLVESQYVFIRLTQFQKDAGDLVASALKRLKGQASNNGGVKGIILDLRQNPGGLLDEAVNVSSIFLKSGVVVSTEERNPQNKEFRYVKQSGYKDLETPMIILINASSASASEIVAGALQDHKRAIIMGARSFGKGSVQTVIKVDDESGIKITMAQYMTPNNRKIQAIGIEPDIAFDEVEATWAQKVKQKTQLIRENDLRNHLTATRETAEEKALRLESEHEERVANANKSKKEKEEGEEENIFNKYNPETDYQVIQAINFLKGFNRVSHLYQKS